MGDEPEDYAIAAILRYLQDQYLEKPNYWFLAPEIHIKLKNELEEQGYDTIQKTIGLVQIMSELGLLRERNKGYQISSKGRNDLETVYNDDWIAEKMAEYARKQKDEKLKKQEQYELDERRHQEMIKSAREGNKIQKYGVWVAIALGAVGLIVAIFKP